MCQSQAPSNKHVSSAASSSSPKTTISQQPLSFFLTESRLEEIRDEISLMKRQEMTTYPPLAGLQDPWRPIMTQWMLSMVDIFQLMPIVLSSALWYLDHAAPLIQSPSDYQLAGLTSLQLAIKTHETRIFPLNQLVRIGDSGITAEDVVSFEQKLLTELQWKLHPPTVECFVYSFSELLPECHRVMLVQSTFRYIRQAVLEEHNFESSILAYASMLVALEEVAVPLEDKQSFCRNILQVADLSASSPGLSKAFDWLYPHQSETRCETPPPKQEPHMQDVISYAEEGDGFEVTWCCNGHDVGTLSPRNVVI